MKKYKLVESDIPGLFRVVALVAFGCVAAGEQGGYVEGEHNLSHAGDAWVYDNACVYGNAQVYGDARVYGDAQVYGNAQVSGKAWVFDNAQVYGNAQVFDNAQVSGYARVSGNAVATAVTHYLSLQYKVTITDQHLRAGCQQHTFAEWESMTPEQIHAMDGDRATEFYPHLIAIMRAINAARGYMEQEAGK